MATRGMGVTWLLKFSPYDCLTGVWLTVQTIPNNVPNHKAKLIYLKARG